jgi:NO-binding membrane sensor protein with MHYT domain
VSHINHFSHGALTPVLAYIMSSVGSMLGLLFTARARAAQGGARVRWLIGAALSIGGTGIWVMHFIAMMGFEVPGSPIRYDVLMTITSAVLAIVIVGVGLLLVSYRGEKFLWLLAGGVLTGVGVAGMHYLGMAAMNMSVVIGYDPAVVALSVVIAVVAATVALWFTLRVRGALATGGAALLMGVAVSGMHYTGMFAMEVKSQVASATVLGARGIDFLMPLLVLISLLTLGLLLGVMLAPPEHELRADALLLAELEQRRSGRTPVVPSPRKADRPPSLFDDRHPR